MRNGKRIWQATLMAAVICGSAFAQPGTPPAKPGAPGTPIPAPAAPGNAIAATVNGQPIPEVAVQRGLKRVPPDKHAMARPEIIDYLVENTLIDQFLQQMKVVVEKKDIDTQISQMQVDLKKSGQTYENLLKEMSLTEEELRTHIAADLRWNKYAESQAADKALREMFETNKDMFNGAMVHARHILMSPAANDPKGGEQAKTQLLLLRGQIEKQVTDGLASLPANTAALAREQLRAKLLEDAFAAAARDKSSCPSKDKGGDVGWFPRAGSMVEPFAKAAFSLKSYQMSDAVNSQFGYHLILVVDRKAGKDVKFEDVKEDVKEVYTDRLRESLVARLKQTAKIVITPPQKP